MEVDMPVVMMRHADFCSVAGAACWFDIKLKIDSESSSKTPGAVQLNSL
jgi:hypothetical protein